MPLHFVCEFIARRYEDRTILRVRKESLRVSPPSFTFLKLVFLLQRSLYIVFFGLFCTLNFTSLFSLAQKVPILLSDTDEPTLVHPYDWKIGIFQYCIGMPIAFMGLISIEGSALSILSKLSPPKFKGVAVHTGTIAVFLALIARCIAALQLFFVGLSHRLINTDIINAGK